VFQSTPLAYDPTNQFNVPNTSPLNQGQDFTNTNGAGQYTPNIRQDSPTGDSAPGFLG
jgi:hypothetical protein